MTHDNHGWDDDEETIINFTPKQRITPARGPEGAESAASDGPPNRAHAPGAMTDEEDPAYLPVPQVPPLMSMETPLLGVDSSHAGMETPPASGLYGTQAPNSRHAALHAQTAPAHEASTGGQDPYLTFSGMQDALPPASKGGQFPTLPPLPPLPGEAHQNGRQEELGRLEQAANPAPSVPSLPGFGEPARPGTPAHQDPPAAVPLPPVTSAEPQMEQKRAWWEAPDQPAEDQAPDAHSGPDVKQPWWQAPSTPEELPAVPPLPQPVGSEAPSGIEGVGPAPSPADAGVFSKPEYLNSEETVIDAPPRRPPPDVMAELYPEPEMTGRDPHRAAPDLSGETHVGFAPLTPSVPTFASPEVPALGRESVESAPSANRDATREDIEDSGEFRWPQPTPSTPDREYEPQATVNLGKPGTPDALRSPEPRSYEPAPPSAEPVKPTEARDLGPETEALTPELLARLQGSSSQPSDPHHPTVPPIPVSAEPIVPPMSSGWEPTVPSTPGPSEPIVPPMTAVAEPTLPPLVGQPDQMAAPIAEIAADSPIAGSEAPGGSFREQSNLPATQEFRANEDVSGHGGETASPGTELSQPQYSVPPVNDSSPGFAPPLQNAPPTIDSSAPMLEPSQSEYADPATEFSSPGFAPLTAGAASDAGQPPVTAVMPQEAADEHLSAEPTPTEPEVFQSQWSQMAAPTMEPAPSGAPQTEPVNIDPPTVMDVPLAAQRVLDTSLAGTSGSADSSAAAKQGSELSSPASDQATDRRATGAATGGGEAAGQADAPDAVGEPDRDTELEWAKLCEAAVSANQSVPPLPAPGSTPDRPLSTSPQQASAQAGSLPTTVPDTGATDEKADDLAESEMEKTNLHITSRATSAVADVAWLAILKSPTAPIHQIFRLDALRMEMGRTMDAPIFVDDRTVSSRHAAIRYERVEDRFEFVLYDLASTNGSFVNGANVHMAVLKDNDRIRVGETELVFKKVEDPPALMK